MRVSKTCLVVFLMTASCYRDPQATPGDACWVTESCGWPSQIVIPDAEALPSSSSCILRPVDPLRSLLIREPSVLQALSARDKPATNFDFRGRMMALATSETGAQQLTSDWLHQIGAAQSIPTAIDEPYSPRVEVPGRPDVGVVLQCPWLKLDVNNHCDADCTNCNKRGLDLKRAPFVLLAIVNRMDLAADQSPCGHDGGELRLIYTGVAPNGFSALPFTVIFEYQVALTAGHDRRWYAEQWQQLSDGPGSTLVARLQAWLDPVLRNATLLRVRTNEQSFGLSQGLPWELRQFEPRDVGTDAARLVQTRVPHTPPLARDNTHELVSLIEHESASIVAGDNRLPKAWLAGSAVLPTPSFAWQAIGADPVLKQAFNRNTCNGCHGDFAGSARGFQHVGPASQADVRTQPAWLSTFLHNPGAPDDELRRRKTKLEAILCTSCPTTAKPDAGAYEP